MGSVSLLRRLALVSSLAVESGVVLSGCQKIRCMPSGVVCVKGVPVKVAEANINKTVGNLLWAKLSADAVIQGINFKSGTFLRFEGEDQISSARLSADTSIQGIDFKAGSEIYLQGNNGKLSLAKLSADTVVENVKYKAGTDVGFKLGSGKVVGGTLAENTNIIGAILKAGTTVSFHDVRANSESKLFSGTLGADSTIQGSVYPAEAYVFFGLHNNLESVILNSDATIQEIPFKSGAQLWFDWNGKVKTAFLLTTVPFATTTIQGNVFESGTHLAFEKGKVKSATTFSFKPIALNGEEE